MENNESAILEGLNSEQKAAVSCVDGPVLIVAGAGSGKTRVLTSRIAYILEQGCDPERILALTFTKKAASEMKERIAVMVGARKARRLYMGTFHSVFIRFLREYATKLGYPESFTIYDTGDSQSAIKACVKELKLDEKTYKPKEVQSRISMAKNNLVGPAAYKNSPKVMENDIRHKKPHICDIYALYATKCKQSGVMDFDDILMNMYILLQDAEIRKAISERFDYIMVDEYQDTNRAQYAVLRLLAAPRNNLCVVGDDSQSIYSFRGARIANILNFKKDYPAYHLFRLEQNYRSTQNIVNAANSVIERNSERIPKNCYSAAGEGEKIRLISAYTEKEEALLIASDIMSRLQADHAEYQDFAILYRTNAQSRAIEEALRRRNLPYMVYSGNSFFDRAEVKDVMAYLKLAANPNDDESFKRIVNKPTRGIGDTTIAALTAAAKENGESLFMTGCRDDLDKYGIRTSAAQKINVFCQMIVKAALEIPNKNAHSLAVGLAVDSGIYGFYKDDNSIEGQAKLANVEELLSSIQAYIEERNGEYLEDLQADGEDIEGKEFTDADFPMVTLNEYLENVSLLSAIDVDDEESNNRVALMTVHSSKGLEFPYVYVTGLEENIFPSGGFSANPADIEEERRLFYVAMTRAKKVLQLSFAESRMRNGQHESNSPSRFIREIDCQYVANPLEPDGMDDVSAWRNAASSAFGSGNGSWSGYHSRSGVGSGNRHGMNGNYGTSGRVIVENNHSGARPTSMGIHSGTRPTSMGIHSETRTGAAVPPRAGMRPVRAVSNNESSFVSTSVLELQSGQRVEHNRFGYGVILSIEGNGIDKKAKIRFDNHGEKILLLKYAKIRKVDL